MGNLNFSNGYEHEICVYGVYSYNNATINRSDIFKPEMTLSMNARSDKYDYVILIRIETVDGIILSEYSQEYLDNLRKIYKIGKDKNREHWVFTEKGLFFLTLDIYKRFGENKEKYIEYYRSDEAVKDLQAMLEAGGF